MLKYIQIEYIFIQVWFSLMNRQLFDCQTVFERSEGNKMYMGASIVVTKDKFKTYCAFPPKAYTIEGIQLYEVLSTTQFSVFE